MTPKELTNTDFTEDFADKNYRVPTVPQVIDRLTSIQYL